jgi:hypothetical protein
MTDPFATWQGDPVTKQAGTELPANRFVKLDPEVPSNVVLADTRGEAVLGVVETAHGPGDEVPVRTAGVKFVESGEALSAAALICTDEQGRAVAVSGETDTPAGRGMSAASGPGEMIGVLLEP